MDYTLQYAITLGVSFGVSFALTWVIWKEEEEGSEDKETKSEKAADSVANQTEVLQKNSSNGESKTDNKSAGQGENTKAGVLYVPVQGNVISRSEIPDETFASGMLGDGIGIEPETGIVTAPCDGEISTVADTLHAIGMVSPDGMEVLIHVGIDTVNMKGDGFTVFVSAGETVKAGQKLLTFDIEKIHAAGYSATTAVLVANSFQYPAFQVEKTGKMNRMERVICVTKESV